MKHTHELTERHFNALCEMGKKNHRFYLLDNPRYFALFRCIKEPAPAVYKGAVQTIGTQDRHMLYIYDSESHNGSVAFKVYKEGVLGLHGDKKNVADQMELVNNVVGQVYHQALG